MDVTYDNGKTLTFKLDFDDIFLEMSGLEQKDFLRNVWNSFGLDHDVVLELLPELFEQTYAPEKEEGIYALYDSMGDERQVRLVKELIDTMTEYQKDLLRDRLAM